MFSSESTDRNAIDIGRFFVSLVNFFSIKPEMSIDKPRGISGALAPDSTQNACMSGIVNPAPPAFSLAMIPRNPESTIFCQAFEPFSPLVVDVKG